MADVRTGLRGAAWLFYAIFVLEILFMISPASLYFYSVYGPALSFLDRSPATAWLTQFFLPHISTTASPVLNLLGGLGWLLVLVGLLIFLAGALPLYWAKLRGRGAVTGGLYCLIRHPQYVGLALMGFGVLLVWPRFLVLVSLIVMLFLYGVLARWKEAQCLARFGESYRAYQAKTGMFVPRALSLRLPRLLPASGPGRTAAVLVVFVAVMGLSVAATFGLRNYSLSQVTAIYHNDVAILSPARLTAGELDAAYRTARDDAAVQAALDAAKPTKQIVYVIPRDWHLARLAGRDSAELGRRSSWLRGLRPEPLQAVVHDPAATGPDIVKAA